MSITTDGFYSIEKFKKLLSFNDSLGVLNFRQVIDHHRNIQIKIYYDWGKSSTHSEVHAIN